VFADNKYLKDKNKVILLYNIAGVFYNLRRVREYKAKRLPRILAIMLLAQANLTPIDSSKLD